MDAGCGRGAPDGVVERGLDPADVGDVALRHGHLGEAPAGGRHDPRVAEDGHPRSRRLGPDRPQRVHQRRVGRVADGVLERRPVLVLAGAALAEREQSGGAAGEDRVDEDAAVVAADRHRHQLGVWLDRVELRGDARVLRAGEVTRVRGAAGDVGELRPGRARDDVRVVADRAQALKRRRRIGREDPGGGAVGVAERDVAKRRRGGAGRLGGGDEGERRASEGDGEPAGAGGTAHPGRTFPQRAPVQTRALSLR